MEASIRARIGPVVHALSNVPEVAGILCFGSYAAGTFDADSDVDLYVLCQPDVAPAHARLAALQSLESIQNLEVGHRELGWDNQWCPQEDRCRVDGLAFELSYNTVRWMQTVVYAVKELGATSTPEFRFRPYTLLGLLDNSAILHDPTSILQATKVSLYPYPEKLRAALLDENRQIARASLQEMQDIVRRSIGNTAFHFHLSRLLDSLCTILYALNRRYDPATKRAEEALERLQILPDRFLERYRKLLEMPFTPEGRQTIVEEIELFLSEADHLAKDTAP